MCSSDLISAEVTLKDWAADGSAIFYESFSPLGTDIWVLPLSGERKPYAFLKASFNEYDPRLSPDGKLLAYVSDESGRDEIYVQSYPDRNEKWQISTRGGSDPHWGAKSDEIDYLSADQQMMSVPLRRSPTIEPGTPVALFQANILFPGGQRSHYAVTRDGQTFILYSPAASRSLPTTTVVVNWMAEIAKR